MGRGRVGMGEGGGVVGLRKVGEGYSSGGTFG